MDAVIGLENDDRVTNENNTKFRSETLNRLAFYMEALSGYQTVQDADMDSMANLIIRAKGPSRSMRRFSEVLEVSPAKMSRIMNQKTAGPLDNELLAQIAANADPESGITLDMLMRANGEAPKGSMTRTALFEETARRTLMDELVKRHYSVSVTEQKDSTVRRGSDYLMRFDFAIETDAVVYGNDSLVNGKPVQIPIQTDAVGYDDDRFGKWLFELKTAFTSPVDSKHTSGESGHFRQWLAMVMSLYYCGTADADRISYVTDQRELFDHAKEILEGVHIPNEISAILIREGRVVEEFVAPVTGRQPKEVFYEIVEGDAAHSSLNAAEEPEWDMDAFSK